MRAQNFRLLVANCCPSVILFLLAAATSSWAQLTQPARYEKEQKSSYRDFTVISLEDQGIALIRDKQKYEHGENLWEVVLVDSALNEAWAMDMPIENRYNLIGHEYRDRVLYFLFRMGETDQGKLKIIKIDCKTGQKEEHNYEPELTIRLTHFNVVAAQVILAGYVSSQPTVLLYNLANDHAKVVPGLMLDDSELLDVRVNVNQTFNVLLAERQSKSKKRLIAKTFDQEGALLLDDIVETDPSKSILTAFTSTLIRDELMIIGTWGEGTTKQASGVFSVQVDPYSEQQINFYDFAQLTHFLDYLSPKRAAKTKEKSDRRRQLGKTPEFKVAILPARIEETKQGFLFYAEAYYSSTSQNSNRWNAGYPYNYPFSNPYGFNNYPYRLYNSPYNYGYPFDSSFGSPTVQEAKMLHASLIEFDAKGNLVADHGLKLEDFKIFSPEQVSDFICGPTKCTLVFSKEKEIRVQVTQRDGVVLTDEKIAIHLKSPTETIKSDSEEIEAIRYWYGNFMFMYGYHTIKNMEKGNRDVFFINKLKIE
jgi:hypothetical protein